MCFGGGDNGAGEIRRQEYARTARVNAGAARIKGIFEGGTRGEGVLTRDAIKGVFDPRHTYYTADGKAQTFTSWKDFAKAVEQGNVYRGRKDYGTGYDQSFYDKRRDAYSSFANPQLDQQYGNAQQELAFALARSGILDSSAAARKNSEAAREYGIRRQEIADKARGFADQTKNAVEGTKADLLGLNANLADPDQSVNIALARARTLEAMPQFQPLGTLFQNATAGIATLADAERRRNAYSGAANYYSTSPTSGGGSGRVVR